MTPEITMDILAEKAKVLDLVEFMRSLDSESDIVNTMKCTDEEKEKILRVFENNKNQRIHLLLCMVDEMFPGDHNPFVDGTYSVVDKFDFKVVITKKSVK